MPPTSVVPSVGWGVLHLFFSLRRELLDDTTAAAKDFAERLEAFDARDGYQLLAFSVLGQKADIGLLALGPDLAELDRLSTELTASPLGAALIPAASYLSLTELSEYTSTADDESRRLQDEEGLAEGSPEHAEALAAFTARMADYQQHRLHPALPKRKVIGFYPMSKRRAAGDNWYTLDFAERNGSWPATRVGRSYRGRVLQLITGSTGLDDWEWGVTLLADDPAALKDIVYEMRFDEVSARYGEFGPFVVGLVLDPPTSWPTSRCCNGPQVGIAGPGHRRSRPSLPRVPQSGVDGVLEALARLERGGLGGGDLQLLAGLRVAPRAGRALADLEGAESRQRHLLALLQGGCDRVQHGVERLGDLVLVQTGLVGGGFGELAFVHLVLLVWRGRRRLGPRGGPRLGAGGRAPRRARGATLPHDSRHRKHRPRAPAPAPPPRRVAGHATARGHR